MFSKSEALKNTLVIETGYQHTTFFNTLNVPIHQGSDEDQCDDIQQEKLQCLSGPSVFLKLAF